MREVRHGEAGARPTQWPAARCKGHTVAAFAASPPASPAHSVHALPGVSQCKPVACAAPNDDPEPTDVTGSRRTARPFLGQCNARTGGQAIARPRRGARLAALARAAWRAGGAAMHQRVHRGLHHGQHRGGALGAAAHPATRAAVMHPHGTIRIHTLHGHICDCTYMGEAEQLTSCAGPNVSGYCFIKLSWRPAARRVSAGRAPALRQPLAGEAEQRSALWRRAGRAGRPARRVAEQRARQAQRHGRLPLRPQQLRLLYLPRLRIRRPALAGARAGASAWVSAGVWCRGHWQAESAQAPSMARCPTLAAEPLRLSGAVRPA
jgi:hypothetical protein